MFKTGLQLFAEAVSGKKIVYLYRLAGKAKEEAAKILRLRQKMEEQKARMQTLQQRRMERFVHLGLRKQKSRLLLSLRRKIS